ncbi:MAG TPA: hypothetical protein VKB38_03895 [Terracidiphilus sp.]|nr:hypothetical protein [Terracidiphilus sp.]
MNEYIIRFLVGGAVVSFFAVMGEVLRPKSFAGLFSAAPSIALATIGVTIAHHGKLYAAVECRSMVFGALGFFVYASAACWLMMRCKVSALLTTVALLPLWFGASAALLWMVGR